MLKKLAQSSVVIIPIVLILTFIYNILFNFYIVRERDYSSQKFPIYHWIMLGLSEYGGYNDEDFMYTYLQEGYENRKNAEIVRIKQRLSELNFITLGNHLNKKLNYTWSDGTYYAPCKLDRQPLNKNIMHEFVLEKGEYTDYYKYWPQIMHFGMLIFIVINAGYILKNKEYSNKNIVLILTMYGQTIFLLIWETRSRYLLAFLPIMLMLSLGGIDTLSKIRLNHKKG